VVTEDGGTPCGACRQVLREFVQQPDEASVHVSNAQGNLTSYSVNELLPNSFQFPKL
jgi:cytidine deaminase